MKAKIAKWGNSLAVRLPKQFVDELGLKPGLAVDLEKDGTRVAIETAPQQRKIPYYRLEDLLAQIKPGINSPPLEDWGILPSEWPQEDWSDIAPTDAEWDAWKRQVKKQTADERKQRKQGPPKPKEGSRGAVRTRRRV
jgi:antitoxin MazE